MGGTTCQVHLTNVVFSPTPVGNVLVDIDVRNILDDAGNPSSWNTVEHNVVVGPNGVFSPVIDLFLFQDQSYQLRIKNGCSTYYEQVVCQATTTTTSSSTTTTTTIAGADLDSSQYSVGGNNMAGSCNINSSYSTRSSSAAASDVTGRHVSVQWEDDQGCSAQAEYIFAPGAIESAHLDITLSCGNSQCNSVGGTILSVF